MSHRRRYFLLSALRESNRYPISLNIAKFERYGEEAVFVQSNDLVRAVCDDAKSEPDIVYEYNLALVVSEKLKLILEEFGEIDSKKLTIAKSPKKLHTRYYVIRPKAVLACANESESRLIAPGRWSRFVLDETCVPSDVHVFRAMGTSRDFVSDQVRLKCDECGVKGLEWTHV